MFVYLEKKRGNIKNHGFRGFDRGDLPKPGGHKQIYNLQSPIFNLKKGALTVNSQQLSAISILMAAMLLISGCESFRYAATEAQKENAWLHREVCAAAAETAVDENASQRLCDLTSLAHGQSGAFVMDYGLPEVASNSRCAINPSGLTATSPSQGRSFWPLAEGEFQEVLTRAKHDSMQKPDIFEMADGLMEHGIALAGLVGGVYGLRIAGYLKQAREKSKALKEIVEGNELFKQLYPEQANRFKEAQQKQSPLTKQIVTHLKAG
jgi:hypothetical protein